MASSQSSVHEESEKECFCGLKCKVKTSWTENNPERRFYSFPNYKTVGKSSCKYFDWYEPKMTDRERNIIVGFMRKTTKLENEIKYVRGKEK
ncbi:unnamed protein product [Ilex paraguariensis]|uniref:GRF-type domain-containing protein n=1 Tax=Ilex paraguariensis TaxID=185542 RepID=A0ABC8RX11_9AQUA